MACDLLDLKCIFVNELFGSIIFTLIALTIIYFIIASKLKFGFDTTIFMGFVIIFIGAIAIGNLLGILGFATLIIAILLAETFNKILKN